MRTGISLGERVAKPDDSLLLSTDYGALHDSMTTRMRTGISLGERAAKPDDSIPYSTDKGALHNYMSTRMRTGIFPKADPTDDY